MQSLERQPAIAFEIDIKERGSSVRAGKVPAVVQRLEASAERPQALTLEDIQGKLAKAEANRQKLLLASTEKQKCHDQARKRKQTAENDFSQNISHKLEKENLRAEEFRAAAITKRKERLIGHNRQVEERCTRRTMEVRAKAEKMKEALSTRLTLAEQRRAAHIEEVKSKAKTVADAAKKFNNAEPKTDANAAIEE